MLWPKREGLHQRRQVLATYLSVVESAIGFKSPSRPGPTEGAGGVRALFSSGGIKRNTMAKESSGVDAHRHLEIVWATAGMCHSCFLLGQRHYHPALDRVMGRVAI